MAVQSLGLAQGAMKGDRAVVSVAVLPYAVFRYFWNCPYGPVPLLMLMLATFFKASIPPKQKNICMFVIMNIYNMHIY